MDKHLTVLGALLIVWGLMGLIGMLVVFAIFSIGSVAIGAAAVHEPDVPGILTLLPLGLGLFICLTIAVSTLPSLIAGYGLLLRRRWAPVWALVAGILNLPGMPIGTGIGIYAIWVFLQDDTKRLLSD